MKKKKIFRHHPTGYSRTLSKKKEESKFSDITDILISVFPRLIDKYPAFFGNAGASSQNWTLWIFVAFSRGPP